MGFVSPSVSLCSPSVSLSSRGWGYETGKYHIFHSFLCEYLSYRTCLRDLFGGVALMAPESNALAARNGCLIEKIVRTLYPDAQFDYKGLVDLQINGHPVEIKSCQISVSDQSHRTGIRSGRFAFSAEQHKSLIQNRGEYILMVHKNGEPFLFFRIQASALKIPEFSGIKSVCWKSIVSRAV